MDANDKVARFAEEALAQCRRNPRLRELCTLTRPIVRLLARGRPIAVGALAGLVGWPVERVEHVLHSSPDAEWTANGLLNGLCVTLRPTPHLLTVAGRTLYVWCAFHALAVPAILGKEAHLESACVVTGTRIQIDIATSGFALTRPDTAVVAVTTFAGQSPDRPLPTCIHQSLFRDPAVTTRWAEDHPHHRLLSVHDASLYARLMTSC